MRPVPLTEGRHIYVGDIHGCLHEFQALMQRVKLTPTDRVVCLGDFLDKGPFGAECVRWAQEQEYQGVQGNHEERYLRYIRHQGRGESIKGFVHPMGSLTTDEQEQLAKLTPVNLAWLRAMPALDVMGPIVAVHGGLLPGLSLRDQPLDKVLRVRWLKPNLEPAAVDYTTDPPTIPEGALLWTDVYDQPEWVVYGHEAHSLDEPFITKTPGGALTFGIDTGCVHGGHLTALIVPNLQPDKWAIEQVPSARKYAPMHRTCHPSNRT